MLDGVISGKTGFTAKAGYCYVGAYRQNDRTYTFALLACGWPNHKNYKWEDSKALISYGNDHYENRIDFKRGRTSDHRPEPDYGKDIRKKPLLFYKYAVCDKRSLCVSNTCLRK